MPILKAQVIKREVLHVVNKNTLHDPIGTDLNHANGLSCFADSNAPGTDCSTKTKYKKGDKASIAALFARGLKQCSVCGEIKPLDAFSKHKYSRNGLRVQCALCVSRKNGSFQFKAEADALAVQGLKKCRQCLQVKNIEDFDFYATGRNGRNTRCRVCAAVHKASKPKPAKPLTRAQMSERISMLEARLKAARVDIDDIG